MAASSSSNSSGLVEFASSSSSIESSTKSSYFSSVTGLYDRFSKWRTSLGLPNPGTIENIAKEAKLTHLTNFFFDGARADLAKVMSANPAFQVTHSFSLASQMAPPTYTFGAIYGTERLSLHGNVDHEGHLSARANWGWTPSSISKVNLQLTSDASMNMVQLEHDYQGSDYSFNIKALNPSPIDLRGAYVTGYLQSITKNLAVGAETLIQRFAPGMDSFATSYMLKYANSQRNWIGTAQVHPSGLLQTTYWQKLSDKVEFAADLQVISAQGKRDAIATVGAKYELRMATFRGQIDSAGKVAAFLEQHFSPSFSFVVSGEIDHLRNAAKIGLGVMLQSSNISQEEMAMAQQQQQQPYAYV